MRLGAARHRIGPNSMVVYTNLLDFSRCSSSASKRSSDIALLDRNWGADEHGLRWISSPCVEVLLLLLLPSAVLDLTVDGKANPCCLLSMVLSYKQPQPGAPICLAWGLTIFFFSSQLSKVS